MLVGLDNEVVFKKAFTNKEVFVGFIKDILGFEVEVGKIETEKSFSPKIGNIAFKYDVFAETLDKRMIIEIQKVDYDHNFDRFLHYHLQAITQQQQSSRDYTIAQIVYTIVLLTVPYTVSQKNGQPIQDEFLLSTINPKNLKGKELEIYGHQLIFLNPNYRNEETPPNIKDWLDLIYESIHNPKNPHINLANPAIKKAAELIDYNDMSSEEITESKNEEARKITLSIYEERGMQKGMQKGLKEGMEKGMEKGERRAKIEMAKKMMAQGFSLSDTAELTGLKKSEIKKLIFQ